jgi:hypothetical protein
MPAEGVAVSFGSISALVVSAVKATPDFSIFPDAPKNEWDLYVTVKMPAMTKPAAHL